MAARRSLARHEVAQALDHEAIGLFGADGHAQCVRDRKSTRLNSSHSQISYAVFCLKKKTSLCGVGDSRCRADNHTERRTRLDLAGTRRRPWLHPPAARAARSAPPEASTAQRPETLQ